jgi:2-dehydropantoate 2-reductase
VITGTEELRVRPELLLRRAEELWAHRDEVGVCFICTKAWALQGLLPELSEALHPRTVVVSFQNGIGTEDDIAQHVAPERVGRAVVNLACSSGPDGSVALQWFKPPNYLGAIDGGAPAMQKCAQLLSEAGLTTEFMEVGELRKRVFFKTILNASMNGLCASAGTTMRQAMQWRPTRALIAKLVREGLSVGEALGYRWGRDAHEECMLYLSTGGDHMPSMWSDLQNRRPTEIDYLNGRIVSLGRRFEGVGVEANLFIASLIMALELKSGARAEHDVPAWLER